MEEQPIRGSIADFQTRRPFMSAADQDQCWADTLSEVADGLLEGPFELEEVEQLFRAQGLEIGPITPRFLIHQSDKDRLIDDARKVNSSSWSTRKVPMPSAFTALALATSLYDFLDTGDASGCFSTHRKRRRTAVAGEMPSLPSSSSRGTPAVGGILADVKKAYKTVPIQLRHRRFNVIAVFCPERQRYMGFIGNTMLFGNLHSVIEWVRFAQFLLSIQKKVLGIPSDIYLDDLHGFVPRAITQTAKQAMAQVWTTLGVPYKPHKIFASTDEGRDDVLPLLGLEFLLAARPRYRVSAGRKADIRARSQEILRAGTLSPAQASKFVGQINFPLNSIIDRRFSPMLKPLLARVYGLNSHRAAATPLSRSIRAAIGCLADAVQSLPERYLAQIRPNLVLESDAAWRKGKGRVSGILHDPTADALQGWFIRVESEDIPPCLRRNPINFLEAAAAVINARVFKDEVTDADALFALDSTAAEGTLEAMSSKQPYLAACAFFFWRDASLTNTSAWITRVPSNENLADWLTSIDLCALAPTYFNFSSIRELSLADFGSKELLSGNDAACHILTDKDTVTTA